MTTIKKILNRRVPVGVTLVALAVASFVHVQLDARFPHIF